MSYQHMGPTLKLDSGTNLAFTPYDFSEIDTNLLDTFKCDMKLFYAN